MGHARICSRGWIADGNAARRPVVPVRELARPEGEGNHVAEGEEEEPVIDMPKWQANGGGGQQLRRLQ